MDKRQLKKELRQRTLKQNAALHKWLSLIGIELNMAGYPVQVVLAKTLDVDWDKDGRLAKELLWRKVQKVALGKTSTTELEKTGDIDIVYDNLNRFLGENFGVHVDWPTEEQMLADQEATMKLQNTLHPSFRRCPRCAEELHEIEGKEVGHIYPCKE